MPGKRLSIFASALALLAATPLAFGDVKASIKDVMQSVNNGPTSVVGQLREQVNGTPDDEGWEQVKGRAALIVEASRLLEGMKPPRGGDDDAGMATWKKHVADYRGCAEAAYEAAGKKDAAGAKAAVQNLMKRCAECHKDHQPQ